MNFKREILLSLFLGILAEFVVQALEDEAIVNLPNGPIRGEKFPKFFAFKGIQYAESPVGEKRFEPVGLFREKWTEVKNATEFGAACIQLTHCGYPEEMVLRGEEDCLFLNVYTSSLDIEKNLPVFIYIHGGAFMFGGTYFTPDPFLEYQEAVFVFLQYRLGPMGFLSTEDEVVPGNMGLKDQVVALKWVKENIRLFGGNPDSVTITGMSAGGASTHLHYFSPLSNGLFHRGVSHSGCALNPWVMVENAKKKAMVVANSLECPTKSMKEMIECLKTKPAEEVVRSATLFLPWLYNPFSPFGVVVEKKGSNPFLPGHPEDLLKSGKVSKLPWIVSLTDSEGLYPVADLANPPSRLDELNERWNDLAASVLDFSGTVSAKDQQSIAKFVRNFYFGEEAISEKTLDKLVDMVSDRLFDAGISLAARLHAQFPKNPVYLIYFTFPAVLGIQHAYAPGYTFKGAGHGDDIVMIYKWKGRDIPLTEREKAMVKLYSEFFISYATQKKPQMADVSLIPITTFERMPYLHIKSPDDIRIKNTEGFGNESFWYTLPISEYNRSTPKKSQKTEL
ncbi:venom carboxylesterase-6-like [Phlebotomus papatasi]|uniref:venom carboxylesterase-6-like n=1 Tax=Phlebotomus papatasi TaxID=29031 RepID=UPI00248419C4|nr:venom carboxylesterase-6-like [Phlebotomus papatasi]